MLGQDWNSEQDVKNLILSEPAQILNNIEDEVLFIDSNYRLRFVNDRVLKRLFSGKKDDILGKLCYSVLHERSEPCNSPLWECPLNKVLNFGENVNLIHPLKIDSAVRYVKISFSPLKVYGTDSTVLLEIRRDVTAERELETQIMRRRDQLVTLNHISSAVSVLHNLDGVLRIALEDILGLIRGAVGGILILDEKTQTLSYRVHSGLSPQYVENRFVRVGEGITGIVASTGKPMVLDDISKDEQTAFPDLTMAEGIKSCISVPLKARDKVVGVLNIFSRTAGKYGADEVSLVTSIGDYLGTAIEQTKLYERLERIVTRYKTLLQFALNAQEQEKKRIARELHDETSQSLTSLTLSLQAIIGMAELKGYNDPDFMDKLKKTHSYTVQTSNEIVKLMKELRPTLLDELGLPAAIHRYAKDTLQSHGINVTVDFKGTDQRLPSEVEVSLFRIAQGAIGNILEHSEAKNASINLECDDNRCLLVISDDGKGFDVSKLTGIDQSGRGAGLFIMRERTSLLGGRGYVHSEPGKGTRIIAEIPIKRTAENLSEEMGDEKNKSIDS